MIIQLSAKYHFGAMHTTDTTDGKVTNRAILSTESENHQECPSFILSSTITLCRRSDRKAVPLVHFPMDINDGLYRIRWTKGPES